MSFSKRIGRTRWVAIALIMPFVFMSLDVSAFAQSGDKGSIRINNLAWKVEGDLAVITYDLDGPADETYEVSIVLLNGTDHSFRIEPKSLTGDYGNVPTPGEAKEIRWEFKKDVPGGLVGEGYYFELTVNKAGGLPWYLYALGGTAVVGAAVVVVLKGGNKDEKENKGGPTELPGPPVRPY